MPLLLLLETITTTVLFYVALLSLLFFVAFGVVEIARRVNWRGSTQAEKRLTLLALVLPPLFALVPTVAGTVLHPAHSAPLHHAAACRLLFVRASAFFPAAPNQGAASHALSLVFGGAAGLLLGAGLFRLARRFYQMRKLRGITPHLSPPTPRLANALAHVAVQNPGLTVHRFYESDIPFAASSVIGVLGARCVLSALLVAQLPDDELNALVAHEGFHLRHDTIPAFCVGVIGDVFFFLRPVSRLVKHWHEAAERACDETAARAVGSPLIVASALLRVSGAFVPEFAPAPALPFADSGVRARIETLLHHAQNTRTPAQETALQAAAGWAAALIFALIGAGLLLSSEAVCVAECGMEITRRVL